MSQGCFQGMVRVSWGYDMIFVVVAKNLRHDPPEADRKLQKDSSGLRPGHPPSLQQALQ